MIKIVKEAPDPGVKKEVVCPECGRTLEYVPKDVIPLWRGTDMSGGSDGADGFPCPGCNSAVIISRW